MQEWSDDLWDSDAKLNHNFDKKLTTDGYNIKNNMNNGYNTFGYSNSVQELLMIDGVTSFSYSSKVCLYCCNIIIAMAIQLHLLFEFSSFHI